MFVDPLRQVAAWLTDATNGVNALRTAVPADVGDAAPAAVTVVEASSSAWVARGLIDRAKVGAGPLLLVQPGHDGEATLVDGEIQRQFALDVVVRFAVRKSDFSLGLVQAWGTLRAAARSIMAQGSGMAGTATRNTTTIGPVIGLRYVSLLDELTDDFVVDALVVTLNVADAWAVAGS